MSNKLAILLSFEFQVQSSKFKFCKLGTLNQELGTKFYAAAAPASPLFQRVALKSSTASFIEDFRSSSIDFLSRSVLSTAGCDFSMNVVRSVSNRPRSDTAISSARPLDTVQMIRTCFSTSI